MISLDNILEDLHNLNTFKIKEYLDKLVREETLSILGCGFFSTVYLHVETNKTIKILKDIGTKEFYDWIISNPHSMLPEISYSRTNKFNDFSVIVSKKYQELEDTKMLKTIFLYLKRSLDENGLSFLDEEKLKDEFCKEHFKKNIVKLFEDRIESSKLNGIREFYCFEFGREKLIQILDCIYHILGFLKNKDFDFDIKTENFMMDGDILIFNDPVYNRDHKMSSIWCIINV